MILYISIIIVQRMNSTQQSKNLRMCNITMYAVSYTHLVCELGRQITQQILEAYDAELAESRDKKHYRGKGKRKTCI